MLQAGDGRDWGAGDAAGDGERAPLPASTEGPAAGRAQADRAAEQARKDPRLPGWWPRGVAHWQAGEHFVALEMGTAGPAEAARARGRDRGAIPAPLTRRPA